MVEVICEKTGIKFEASSRRTKNHPTVQEWMQKAYEEGWYSEASTAIYGSTYVEKQRFENIEQFVVYFKHLQSTTLTEKHIAQKAQSEQKRVEEEAHRQRSLFNSLLHGRGYSWRKTGYSNADIENDVWNEEGGPSFYELWSPDGRIVTIREAMQELAFYEDAKFAHEWLARQQIAEEVPAIEFKRREVSHEEEKSDE